MSARDDLPARPATTWDLADAVGKLIKDVTDDSVTLGVSSDGYGKCVEAMWRAAYMAHELVAAELGVTGWQHSSSALHLLGRLNGIDGPYMLIKAEDALYPQYDLPGRLEAWLGKEDTVHWLGRTARERLAEVDTGAIASPRVIDQWRNLIAIRQIFLDAAHDLALMLDAERTP